MPTLSNFWCHLRFIWYALIENTPFVRHKYFYIAGKRPASLVLPTAPRRPTRGGHQAGWATMPGGTRARRQQQNRQVRYDLHLPSMPTLTCKTSSQALLLRVLKVILQLREAARKSASGATSSRTRTSHRRGELELDLQFYVAEYANCFYSRVHWNLLSLCKLVEIPSLGNVPRPFRRS